MRVKKGFTRFRELSVLIARAAMVEADGNMMRAARAMGISRNTLYRLFEEYEQHIEEVQMAGALDDYDALSPKEWVQLAEFLGVDLAELATFPREQLLRRTFWAITRKGVDRNRRRSGLPPLKQGEGPGAKGEPIPEGWLEYQRYLDDIRRDQ